MKETATTLMDSEELFSTFFVELVVVVAAGAGLNWKGNSIEGAHRKKKPSRVGHKSMRCIRL